MCVLSSVKLAAPVSFLETLKSTKLGFSAIQGLSPKEPPTSVKRKGQEGLRVDLLAPGRDLGKAVEVKELGWHAQAVPHFDYVLSAPRRVSMLCRGHCVPVSAPAPERLAWHKLYSSTRRLHDTAKAAKDLRQAATLMAVLVERDNISLVATAAELPKEVLRAARQRLPSLRGLMAAHAQTLDELERAVSVPLKRSLQSVDVGQARGRRVTSPLTRVGRSVGNGQFSGVL